jgi:tetratricopeptide (TPR) repeat protein
MSAHKRAGVVASVNAGMVVSDGKQRRPLSPHIRLWGILLLCVVVLGGAIGMVFHLKYVSDSNKGSTTSTPENKVPVYFSTLNSQERVTYYVSQKNYAAATDIYNNQLTTAKTADDRAQANMGLCGVYTTEQDFQTAYQYALKAYNNEMTVQTATTAGGAAVNAGDKKAAAKYYQVAINLLPKENLPTDQYAYDLRELQAQLQGASQ